MKTILPIVALLLFNSCDCLQHAEGTVIDALSKEPLFEVQVQEENRNTVTVETDVEGEFEFMGISGGIGKCPPMTLVFSKNGYETEEVIFESGDSKIIMLHPS